MTSLRTKGKSTVVWILMGLLLLGLGGFGVTNFAGGSTEIGAVGETEIDARDYSRALDGQLSSIAAQTGERMTIDQARAMGITQGVQAQLFTSAALAEEARLAGVSVGDKVVAQQILDAPAFRGPTGFDRAAYRETLRREGLDEREFEEDVRADTARLILQQAVVSGVEAPETQVSRNASWLLEKRDISWVELTEADLGSPIVTPDEDTLKAWHQANASRFTAPEIRKITYAWITPEMLADEVELDDAALREIYEERVEEYQQPERRLVGRLVFESPEAAAAAKTRLDAGEASFEDIAQERGLTLADTDLGAQSEAELGKAGAAVFATEDNGVVGPVETDLGPALIAVNAILDPVNVSFEEALPALRAEAAEDRARRLIADRAPEVEDLLAGGATLEQVAEETALQLAKVDFTPDMEADPGQIAGYPAFRERAMAVTDADFPELIELDDGGVFALRLDEIVPPSLIPFEEVREKVAADWARGETHRLLLDRAEDIKLQVVARTMPDSDSGTTPRPAAPEWTAETGLLRDGYLEAAPRPLLDTAFKLGEGETEIVDDGNRVALVRVDRIEAADLSQPAAANIVEASASRLGRSLQGDIFDYYARAVQSRNGVTLNRAGIAAVESRM